jgi:predicted PurR-regulated permease PerM
MNLARPVTFWIATLAIGLTVLAVLRDIMFPFVAGTALAYLLDPVVDRLERIGLNRAVATLVIIALFIIGVGFAIMLIVPMVIREMSAFIDDLPVYIRRLQAFASDPNRPWLSKVFSAGFRDAEQSAGELTALGTDFLWSLWADGRALLSLFSLLVVTPIVTFFLIYDWQRMLATIDLGIPAAHRDQVRALAREIDDTVSGFVRGQGSICLILAAFYALALTLGGLNHALLIGPAAGLISFIPYLGALTGLVVSLCMAIIQSWPNWTLIYIVVGTFFVGSFMADYVLAPYLIGPRVKLNPVWLMFAMFAFGSLFGIVGLLVAVPLAAAIGVLVRFGLKQYRAGAIHSDAAEAPALGAEPPAHSRAKSPNHL